MNTHGSVTAKRDDSSTCRPTMHWVSEKNTLSDYWTYRQMSTDFQTSFTDRFPKNLSTYQYQSLFAVKAAKQANTKQPGLK